MANYNNLKAGIDAVIKTNGRQEIFGAALNTQLKNMITELGAGYQFMGVATPTNPGSAQTPDYKCFYLATIPGTYTNLGGLVVADGEVALLKYDTSWTKEVTGAATADQVSQLGQKVENVKNDIKTLADKLIWHIGSFYNLKTGIITEPIYSYACSDIIPKEFEPLISNIEMVGTQTTGITRNSHKSLYLNDTYVGYLRFGEYFTPQGESVSSIEYNYFAINEHTVSGYNPSYDTYYVIFSLAKAKAKVEKTSFDKGFYALGDSTTYGAGSTTGNTSWANILTTLADFSNFTKLAANGAFCMYHPNYARLSTQVNSVPSNYDGIITIMIGTNDFMQDSPLGDSSVTMGKSYVNLTDTDNFADSFRYNLETLKRKCPDAIILCITPLPSRDAGDEHGHWDETNLFAIRQIERDICNAMGIPIIESAKEFGLSRYVYDWKHFYSDFLHPNDLGYKRIAHCMLGKFIEFAQ